MDQDEQVTSFSGTHECIHILTDVHTWVNTHTYIDTHRLIHISLDIVYYDGIGYTDELIHTSGHTLHTIPWRNTGTHAVIIKCYKLTDTASGLFSSLHLS